MSEPVRLIKKYPNRRLYDTKTSAYITLGDVKDLVLKFEEFKVVDAKTGDDLTRQYLLQIVAEHESKGESVLPVDVLTDLVRSYTTGMQSVVPQFLAASFDMLRGSQAKLMENLTAIPNPLAAVPGFEAMRKQQEAFLKTMMGGMPGWAGSGPAKEEEAPASAPDDIAEIKQQLAELQKKLSKL